MDIRQQVVTGVIPPELAEARIREVWPSVQRAKGLASLGKMLTCTIILAPLAWMMMAGAYFGKLLPFFMTRYTLTNRRLMVRKGWSGTPAQEVPLDRIDRVEVVPDDNTDFFRAATLKVYSGNTVILELPGVPEAEAFQRAIENARNAWVPGKIKNLAFVPASATK